jgi:hypothetical protein
MEVDALEQIAQRLEAAGQNAGELHELQIELDLLEKPPSLWKRMSVSMGAYARRQWGHITGELSESSEAARIARAVLRKDGTVTAEERAFVRGQILDILRMLPAGAVIFANAVIPLPASSMFTPKILRRLGLMPSRWREAHLLAHLQREEDRLREQGESLAADEISKVYGELEEEAQTRHQIEEGTRLLEYWDLDGNGKWDPDEVQAYETALMAVVDGLRTGGSSRSWFLLEDSQVVGPIRCSSVLDIDDATGILVCRQQSPLWVSLSEARLRLAG